jgi:hypothetical protein
VSARDSGERRLDAQQVPGFVCEIECQLWRGLRSFPKRTLYARFPPGATVPDESNDREVSTPKATLKVVPVNGL